MSDDRAFITDAAARAASLSFGEREEIAVKPQARPRPTWPVPTSAHTEAHHPPGNPKQPRCHVALLSQPTTTLTYTPDGPKTAALYHRSCHEILTTTEVDGGPWYAGCPAWSVALRPAAKRRRREHCRHTGLARWVGRAESAQVRGAAARRRGVRARAGRAASCAHEQLAGVIRVLRRGRRRHRVLRGNPSRVSPDGFICGWATIAGGGVPVLSARRHMRAGGDACRRLRGRRG